MKQDDSAGDSGGALPPPPAALAAVFPRDRIDLITAYAERLAGDGVVRGLIGPREAPRLWDRHIINCGLLAPLLPAGGTVADVGSGAGLPGLVLAIARPDVQITLIEPLLRRTTFLEEVVTDLGLDNVTVMRGKADAVAGKATFDVVTARAVAPLDGLIRWCMPLVSGSGAMLAMKGTNAEAEIEESRFAWEGSGCADPVVEIVGTDIDEALEVEPIRVVRVEWVDPQRPRLTFTGDDAGTDASGSSPVGLAGSRRKPRRGRSDASASRNRRRKA